MTRTGITALTVGLFAAAASPLLSARIAIAQVPGAPVPIPVPPIPAPPQIGAQPPVHLPALVPPGEPVIKIPGPAQLDPLPIPPVATITPADKTDPMPAPQSGIATAAPPMVSPGDAASRIDEAIFIVDPGSSQLSPPAQGKLATIASELAADKAARLEVRIFSPSKAHNESAAHRLSLSRYLAIRDFLTHKGVGEGQIDGRPLLSAPNELNADRVELYIER